MLGSGCKNCPVKACETMNYRGSTCSAQRAKLGLGDPMTNADRIRAMSDEELAKFLCDISTAECCDRSCPARGICGFEDNGMIKWLKQPAEEGADHGL